ncbi:hypothetical protein CDEN61S_03445 [Castellaniella denitrificans]
MSIFKTRHVRAILALCCLGLAAAGPDAGIDRGAVG